ncbi:hypothetical protein D3C79_795670 [compost metagenome]
MPRVPAAAGDEVVIARQRVAADARQAGVTLADVGVERRLRFSHVLAAGLQLLPALLQVLPGLLGDCLGRNLLQLRVFGHGLGTGDAAHLLRGHGRLEGLAATWRFALLRLDLLGQFHADLQICARVFLPFFSASRFTLRSSSCTWSRVISPD